MPTEERIKWGGSTGWTSILPVLEKGPLRRELLFHTRARARAGGGTGMVKKVEEKPPVTGQVSEQVDKKLVIDNNLVVIDEKWFLEKGPSSAHLTSTIEGTRYSIRLDRDSYVWLLVAVVVPASRWL